MWFRARICMSQSIAGSIACCLALRLIFDCVLGAMLNKYIDKYVANALSPILVPYRIHQSKWQFCSIICESVGCCDSQNHFVIHLVERRRNERLSIDRHRHYPYIFYIVWHLFNPFRFKMPISSREWVLQWERAHRNQLFMWQMSFRDSANNLSHIHTYSRNS